MKKFTLIQRMTLTMLVCSGVGINGALAVQPSLGEWTADCNPAFRIAAMPTTWDFQPTQGPLLVNARLAVDYDVLPANDWELVPHENPEESFTRLLGYRDMVLEAQIFAAGGVTPIVRLEGRYSIDDGAQAVAFSWDGRDQAGTLVKAGRYEIQVHGRMIPVSLDLNADQMRYRDLDGWNEVEEACTRTIRVNVTDTPQPLLPNTVRSQLCPNPPPLPSDYYSTVDISNSGNLRTSLHDIIDDHVRFPYTSTSTDTWDILNDADENPSNAGTLLTIYKNEANNDGCSSGCAWNREHTWASSYGFNVDTLVGRIPYTDCHHLRAADPTYNSARVNRPFNDCTSGCTTYATDVNNGFGGEGQNNLSSGGSIGCPNTPTANDIWEPWDHRKGDVARSILYMDVRYEGGTGAMGAEQDLIATDDLSLMTVDTPTCGGGFQDPGYIGVLTTLIAWHNADPVDADEMRRNEQVWCHQGNRNPFVDHPEYVACLYEDNCNSPAFPGISSAAGVDLCLDTGVLLSWSTPTDWNDGCAGSCSRGFKVYRGLVELLSGPCSGLGEAATSCNDGGGTNGITYNYSVVAYNDLGETSGSGTSLGAADTVQDGTPPTITDGPTATPLVFEFSVDWITDEVSNSYVEWGATPGIRPSNSSDSTRVTHHSITATGLDPDTTYHYVICSDDGCGNQQCSSEASTMTLSDPAISEVFINELHYDNAGTDANEGVEIAGTAGTDLTGWAIAVYNGNGGGLSTSMSPNPVPIPGTIPDETDGMGAVWFAIAGIENGGWEQDPATDGIALVDDTNTVIQFLCYEGTFMATAGPATGMTCTDIGVEETFETLATESLQLTGTGCAAADFTWTGPTTSSNGLLNAGQTPHCILPGDPIFDDGFELGDSSAWSIAIP